jgi:RNA polymerase sigma-70 factor, ECF subfamily
MPGPARGWRGASERPARLEPNPRKHNVFCPSRVDTVSSLVLPGAGASGETEELLGFCSSSEPSPQQPPPASHTRGRTTTMPKPTDRELVDRAREGETTAFGELVRRHQQRIHRLAVHMLRDRAEAEDVTQETFIRAFRALERFDGRSEAYTWFYRITINLSLNRIRSRKTSRATHDTEDPRLEALLTDKRPETSDPAGSAQRRQLYLVLCQGIDQLSETLRTTLILVCIDGRSHEDVSTILGAPEGTIAWRIHEARRKLKEFLNARGFDPEGDGT